MKRIAKIRRLLSSEERVFLSKEADPTIYCEDAATLASVREAIEYQISLDCICKPPSIAELLENKQLYLLDVGQPFMLGYEPCFMEDTLVFGGFPRAVVHICYGVVDNRTLGNWPVSYTWKGEAVSIKQVMEKDCPPDERILPVYRCDWIEEAMSRSK